MKTLHSWKISALDLVRKLGNIMYWKDLCNFGRLLISVEATSEFLCWRPCIPVYQMGSEDRKCPFSSFLGTSHSHQEGHCWGLFRTAAVSSNCPPLKMSCLSLVGEALCWVSKAFFTFLCPHSGRFLPGSACCGSLLMTMVLFNYFQSAEASVLLLLSQMERTAQDFWHFWVT